jgi:cell wall-associated NlpC family hydrolase
MDKFHAKLKGKNKIIESMLANGLSYVGRSPYVWGGGRTSSSIAKNQFDCSSFASWMYYLAGHKIEDQGWTTTYSLVNKGTANTWANKKRGDLLLTDNLDHVVIYLGDGYILHDSPNSPTGGVGVNRLTDKINAKYSNKTWEDRLRYGSVRTIVK